MFYIYYVSAGLFLVYISVSDGLGFYTWLTVECLWPCHNKQWDVIDENVSVFIFKSFKQNAITKTPVTSLD